MTADDPKSRPELTDKLNELESLVGQPSVDRDAREDDPRIPILDELVNPEDYTGDETDTVGEPEIDEIADRVEQKLSTELDEIVRLLKGNLKDSIMHELHDQMKKDPGEDKDD